MHSFIQVVLGYNLHALHFGYCENLNNGFEEADECVYIFYTIFMSRYTGVMLSKRSHQFWLLKTAVIIGYRAKRV